MARDTVFAEAEEKRRRGGDEKCVMGPLALRVGEKQSGTWVQNTTQ